MGNEGSGYWNTSDGLQSSKEYLQFVDFREVVKARRDFTNQEISIKATVENKSFTKYKTQQEKLEKWNPSWWMR